MCHITDLEATEWEKFFPLQVLGYRALGCLARAPVILPTRLYVSCSLSKKLQSRYSPLPAPFPVTVSASISCWWPYFTQHSFVAFPLCPCFLEWYALWIRNAIYSYFRPHVSTDITTNHVSQNVILRCCEWQVGFVTRENLKLKLALFAAIEFRCC